MNLPLEFTQRSVTLRDVESYLKKHTAKTDEPIVEGNRNFALLLQGLTEIRNAVYGKALREKMTAWPFISLPLVVSTGIALNNSFPLEARVVIPPATWLTSIIISTLADRKIKHIETETITHGLKRLSLTNL